jgi:hypothetical protein
MNGQRKRAALPLTGIDLLEHGSRNREHFVDPIVVLYYETRGIGARRFGELPRNALRRRIRQKNVCSLAFVPACDFERILALSLAHRISIRQYQ